MALTIWKNNNILNLYLAFVLNLSCEQKLTTLDQKDTKFELPSGYIFFSLKLASIPSADIQVSLLRGRMNGRKSALYYSAIFLVFSFPLLVVCLFVRFFLCLFVCFFVF